MGKEITRTALTPEQIVGVANLASQGFTRADAAKSLKIPEGTIGYIVRRLRKQGIQVNFPRATGDAWDKAITQLKNGVK